MINFIDIESGTLLADIEHNFRVFAGPGAGKTHWLVLHIQNILKKSTRLTPSTRVACISYTNVATEEIRKRLGRTGERVEVCTIHSFLYRYVVKPYLHTLNAEHGFPCHLVRRHDTHHPTKAKTIVWLKEIDKKRLLAPKMSSTLGRLISEKLPTLYWRQENGSWQLDIRDRQNMGQLLNEVCIPELLLVYKKSLWKNGTLDHDDVLYLASRLMTTYPVVCECLSARFQYLFVDEFQDTHPAQTQIVESLAKAGTVVGVIGDEEQSIYSFLGATPSHFRTLTLAGQQDYHLRKNRRSTENIISLLNHVRADSLKQDSHRCEVGEKVCVLIGTIDKAIAELEPRKIAVDEREILTRNNKDAARIRFGRPPKPSTVWSNLFDVDQERAFFLRAVVLSTELARSKQFGASVDLLLATIWKRDKLQEPLRVPGKLCELGARALVLSLLEAMLHQYEELCGFTLLRVYEHLGTALTDQHGLTLKKLITGKGFHQLADQTAFQAMVEAARPPEHLHGARTVHQAKGVEWPSVVVWLSDKQRLDHLVSPHTDCDVEEAEERRVTYVALSRARDRLFVVVPEAGESDVKVLAGLGLEVVQL